MSEVQAVVIALIVSFIEGYIAGRLHSCFYQGGKDE